MLHLQRLARHGRFAALIAAFCPTLQDVITEALANVFTERVPIPASSWIAIPLGLLAGALLERLTDLLRRVVRYRGLIRFPR